MCKRYNTLTFLSNDEYIPMMNMIKRAMISTLCLLSWNAMAATATATATPADPHLKVVSQAITDFMKENDVPGVAVELYINGEPYAYYFGEADREKATPVTD